MSQVTKIRGEFSQNWGALLVVDYAVFFLTLSLRSRPGITIRKEEREDEADRCVYRQEGRAMDGASAHSHFKVPGAAEAKVWQRSPESQSTLSSVFQ